MYSKKMHGDVEFERVFGLNIAFEDFYPLPVKKTCPEKERRKRI